MTKLSGHEATILAFIARYPNTPEAAKKAAALVGDARQIADAIIRADAPVKDSNSAAARGIEQWAMGARAL